MLVSYLFVLEKYMLVLTVLNLPFGKRDYNITELKIRSERNNQNLAY